MEYTDWLWFKFGVLCAAAFLWGIWRGFNGKPLHLEPHERRRTEQRRAARAAGRARRAQPPALPGSR